MLASFSSNGECFTIFHPCIYTHIDLRTDYAIYTYNNYISIYHKLQNRSAPFQLESTEEDNKIARVTR